MSAKHSPAPWRLTCRILADTSLAVPVVEDADGELVVMHLGGATVEQQHANGRLCVAAPDLLAVAHDFRNILEADGAECTCSPGDVCPICRCSAAIQKATGGSHAE